MGKRTLHFDNPRQLSQLYGGKEDNLRSIESKYGAQIVSRDGWLRVEGDDGVVEQVEAVFNLLQDARNQGLKLRKADFDSIVDGIRDGRESELRSLFVEACVIKTRLSTIVPKTIGQKRYMRSIFDNDIVFGIGPAGTGKTYLAMAAAVSKLLDGSVKRLILSRPAVEAGETLGFLPGDLQEKILPYLRPLYDAIYDMIDREDVTKLIEKGVIEIAPLAYMRGRTLSDSFIILDEAQNTTPEQMMMFLTRLGNESKMVITGDITQIDIPPHKTSGLLEIRKVIKSLKGIDFHEFGSQDVVRHHLVQKIVDAYQSHREREQD
ncbi:MAG: PhoH family protein [Verrucomicrobiota bacterium]|nr:PhoH family protein [Verrucomicrobiota bacterium]